MSIKLDTQEKETLARILAEPVLTKAFHISLAAVGDALDATNTLSLERSAMAYQNEAGARMVINSLFSLAELPAQNRIVPKKLKHT